MAFNRKYDLEERTRSFAKQVRCFIAQLPRTIANSEDGHQVIRSSGSIGANYIEANQSLGKKDFCFRLRISRKEARETIYWLQLIQTPLGSVLDQDRQSLLQEATELALMLSSIIKKFEI